MTLTSIDIPDTGPLSMAALADTYINPINELLAGFTGFHNRVINGNFDIWQRGTSFSVGNNTSLYTADRCFVSNDSTGATIAVSKIAAPSGFLGRSAINLAASGVAAGSNVGAIFRLEGQSLLDMDGSAATISFDVNAATSAGSLTCNVDVNTNTALDNGTFSNSNFAIAPALPSGSGRVSVTLSAAQTAGLKNGAALFLYFIQNGVAGNINVSIGAVQFEKAPFANPFEFRPLAVELALCERYFQTSYDFGVAPGTAGVNAGGYVRTVDAATSFASMQCPFRTRMRAVPSITLYSPGTGTSGKVYNGSTAADIAATPNYAGQTGFMVGVSGVSMAAANFFAAAWTASAEL